MIKKLNWITTSLLFFLALTMLLAYTWHQRSNLTSYYLTHKLKLNSSIDELNITSANQFEIKGFKIENLPNSNNPYAFIADNIVINFSLYNLIKNPAIIDKIEVNNPYISLEQYKDLQFNWGKMFKIIDDSSTPSEITSGLSLPKSVFIKSIVLNNLYVEITSDFIGNNTLNIEKFELQDISSLESNKLPIINLIAEITANKLFKILEVDELLKKYLENSKISVKESPEKIIEDINNLFKSTKTNIKKNAPTLEKVFAGFEMLFSSPEPNIDGPEE